MANEGQGASPKWTKTWWGKLALGVAGTVLSSVIVWGIKRNFDKAATPTPTETSKPQLQPQPAQLEPHTPSEATQQTKAKVAAPKSIVRTSGSNSPAVGSITQGAGSALSIGQSGGITAGTISVVEPNTVYNYDGSMKKTFSGGQMTAALQDPNPVVTKIRAELATGQEQDALSDAQGLMRSDPLWATPHILAGLAYVNLHDQSAAKSELQKAKSLVPAGYEFEQDFLPHLDNLQEVIKRHELQ